MLNINKTVSYWLTSSLLCQRLLENCKSERRMFGSHNGIRNAAPSLPPIPTRKFNIIVLLNQDSGESTDLSGNWNTSVCVKPPYIMVEWNFRRNCLIFVVIIAAPDTNSTQVAADTDLQRPRKGSVQFSLFDYSPFSSGLGRSKPCSTKRRKQSNKMNSLKSH